MVCLQWCGCLNYFLVFLNLKFLQIKCVIVEREFFFSCICYFKVTMLLNGVTYRHLSSDCSTHCVNNVNIPVIKDTCLQWRLLASFTYSEKVMFQFSQTESCCVDSVVVLSVVGHGRSRKVPYHHFQLLPWSTWHHRSLWRNRSGRHVSSLQTVVCDITKDSSNNQAENCAYKNVTHKCWTWLSDEAYANDTILELQK